MTRMTHGIRTDSFFYDTRVYLELFDRSMRKDKLSDRFHRQHWEDICDYLAYYVSKDEKRDICEWCMEIDDYMMNGFLKADRTISGSQFDSMLSSLHRFYLCMRNNAVLTFEEYDHVIASLHEGRDRWSEAREEREKSMEGQPKFRRPRGFLF